MRHVIEGKINDTETAEVIGEASQGTSNDFSHYDEQLYRTKKGGWFLAGAGGPRSRWSRPTGQNSWSGGSGIVPLTPDEALAWLEQHNDAETIERYFTLEEA
jgi:hypothetical protein